MGTFSFASEHYIVINIVIFAPLLFRKQKILVILKLENRGLLWNVIVVSRLWANNLFKPILFGEPVEMVHKSHWTILSQIGWIRFQLFSIPQLSGSMI